MNKSMPTSIILILLSLIVFTSGCTTQNTTTTVGPSGCPSPYDGTWKGIIADSGDLAVTRYDSKGIAVYTDNPFTASYDFEMTIQCVGGNDNQWSYDITHVKASHPLFDCADGCTPTNSNLFIGNDGSGYFGVVFPNDADIEFANHEGGLHANPDEKKIELFITGKYFSESIGGGGNYQQDSQGYYYFVETYNCQQYGGEGICTIKTLNPNTIVLTKVS